MAQGGLLFTLSQTPFLGSFTLRTEINRGLSEAEHTYHGAQAERCRADGRKEARRGGVCMENQETQR